jgi:hypothetical protein
MVVKAWPHVVLLGLPFPFFIVQESYATVLAP